MPYIYKITNILNNKVYIGKTSRSIEERWNEHCKQFNQDHLNRPLYNAMKKYGIANFKISILEECNDDIINDREIYWIDNYNSYYEGYNATLGGDGRSIVNSDIIYELFQQGLTIIEIAKITDYSKPTISRVLNNIDPDKSERFKRGHLRTSKPVMMLDKDSEIVLKIFNSTNEAKLYCQGKGNGHISEVCKGQRKTAFGYKWKYLFNS